MKIITYGDPTILQSFPTNFNLAAKRKKGGYCDDCDDECIDCDAYCEDWDSICSEYDCDEDCYFD